MALSPLQFSGRSLVPDALAATQQGQAIAQGQNVLEQQRFSNQQAQLQAQQAQQQQGQAQQLLARSQGGEKIETGQDFAKLLLSNPELGARLKAAAGLDTDQKVFDFAKFGFAMQQLSNDPEAQNALINKRVQEVRARGGDPSDTEALLGASPAQRNQTAVAAQLQALSPKELSTLVGKGFDQQQGLASAKTEFLPGGGSFQAMPNGVIVAKNEQGNIVEGKARQDLLNRSKQFQLDIAKAKADITVDKETKVAAAKAGINLDAEPKIKAAVAQAVADVKSVNDASGEKKSNQVTLNAYSTAMKGLVDSLSGTDTGPFVGLLPALTSNQQIADGAIAAVSPILKQVFRGASEGAFSDSDQALLTAMIPTRTDTPSARQSKLQNIDAIVRAKLNTPSTDVPTAAPTGSPAQSAVTQDVSPSGRQGGQLMTDAQGNSAFVFPDGSFEEVR